MNENDRASYWLQATRGSLAVLALQVKRNGTASASGKLQDWMDECEVLLDNIENELRELADFEGMRI